MMAPPEKCAGGADRAEKEGGAESPIFRNDVPEPPDRLFESNPYDKCRDLAKITCNAAKKFICFGINGMG
jgi:hypothetical protein